MRAPEFWHHEGGLMPALLTPLGGAYAALTHARHALTRAWRASVPVICVGNLVAGGAGKTPVALALAQEVATGNRHVGFLTRGHGGREAGPLRVDPGTHDAKDVGDEALLLAAVAPTWVARDRPDGARAAIAAGAELLIMDDGFQNPSLIKDLSLLVIDGGYGFGNGRLLPAGPLREPLARGLARADAVVLIGRDTVGVSARLGEARPVLRARLVPGPEAERFGGRPVVAFAGIGRPQKFFDTLRDIGCEIVAAHGFADHHRYSEDEIMRLCESAAASGAMPITTEKDAVRLPVAARPMVSVLTVDLVWEDPEAVSHLLRPLSGGKPLHA